MSDLNLKALRRELLIAASEEEPTRLRVLTDEKSYRLAQTIFKNYCGANADFSRFHAFIQDLDRLLARYDGKSPQAPRSDNSESKGEKSREKPRKKEQDKDADEEDPDE